MLKSTPINTQGKYANCLPNEDISLSAETVQVTISRDGENTRTIETEGEIYLALLPFPQIRCRFQLDQIDGWSIFASNPEATFHIERYPSTEWQALKISDGNVIIQPRKQVLLTSDTDIDVEAVVFHLFNYYNYVGESIRTQEGINFYEDRLSLPCDDWHVTIDSVKNIKDRVKEVKGTRGYAITHVGKLESTSGGSFRYEDAQKALSSLGYLLSFTRGLWCFPILLSGRDKSGTEVWQEWSLRLTTTNIALEVCFVLVYWP